MTQEEKASILSQYERDGFLLFPEVLDADLIREAREHITWLQKKHLELRKKGIEGMRAEA